MTTTSELATTRGAGDDGAGRVIEAIVMRGDIAGLSPKDRAAYYLQLCESLHLNPATQPIKFIAFQGKMIPYFGRDATDQLAAMHRLNREVVAGPEVRDFCGHKLLYALCRATHPNGRIETATALVPIPNGGGENLANAVMKTETKSRRRATLAMLGLGFIDESELDTMSGARRLSHAEAMGETETPVAAVRRLEPANTQAADAAIAEQFDVDATGYGESPDLGEQEPPAVAAFRDAVATFGTGPLTYAQCAAIWLDHRAALAAHDPKTATAAWRDLLLLLPEPGGKKSKHAELNRAVKAAEAPKPPPTSPTGTDAPAASAPAATDPPAATGGAAASAGGAAGAQARAADEQAAAWRAHLAQHANPDAVCNSAAKAICTAAYPALGPDGVRRAAIERVTALTAASERPWSDANVVNAIRAAVNNYPRRKARATETAATLAVVANARRVA